MTQFIIAVLAIALCYIQVQEAESLPNAAFQFLDAHNRARAQVGVPPLQWSDHLAFYARNRVRYHKAKYGCFYSPVNNATYTSNWDFVKYTNMKVQSPRATVDAWVSTRKYYDYATNNCSSNEPTYDCDIYKRVVSKYTKEVGCSRVRCGSSPVIYQVSACYYNPDGGVSQGQRPY